MTNQQLIKDANEVLDGLIGKSDSGAITVGDVNFGNFIPREELTQLMRLTEKQSDLMSALTVRLRSRQKGTFLVSEMDGMMLEFVGELDPRQVTNRPSTKRVDYSTKKARAQLVFSYEELEAAREGGIGDFEKQITEDFNTKLADNLENIFINGNTGLGELTRENRGLRGVNGLDVITDTGANVFSAGGGRLAKEHFHYMRQVMPWKVRRTMRRKMRWIYNDMIQDHWHAKLTNIATPLGDRAMVNPEIFPPLGIKPVVAPYITENGGPTAIAPTSVTDNTTDLTLVLSTLVAAEDPPSVAQGVDRTILVKCKLTGETELCVGYKDGSNLLAIDTTGLLGQTSSVSTTASDYEVRVADETNIYLCNPADIFAIFHDEWRTVRRYDEQVDGIIVTIHLELDVCVPLPERIVKLTQIAIPPIALPTAA